MSKPGACLAFAALVLCACTAADAAVDITITCWRVNLTGLLGQSTDASLNVCVSVIPANVQQVQYTSSNVYVRSTGIPNYNVGPFGDGNPAVPSNRNWLFRIPRAPQPQTGTHTATPLGPIGVFVNGVVMFNAKDARSYQNQNIWHQNAVVVEAPGFDAALGHPAPVMNGGTCNGRQNGIYHHHQRPIALLAQLGDNGSRHSPLVGFAYDGFPVYGPYGHDTPAGGGVRRINSSFRLRNITTRTTLPDGTVLAPSQYGPAVSGQYPLGYYIEDFEYVAGLGDLDQYNGRFAITPEYPLGTYAYVATLDANGNSAYPYLVGPTYYGVVAADNQTQTVSVPGAAVTFVPGDLNADGTRSLADVSALALALTDATAYADAYPAGEALNGDMNGDATLDAADLQPFLSAPMAP